MGLRVRRGYVDAPGERNRPHGVSDLRNPESSRCGGRPQRQWNAGRLDGTAEYPDAQDLLTCFELDTDRRPEAIRVQRSRGLAGVEFWTVTDSQRPWAMLHDTFSAWYVRAPRGSACGRWWSRGEERPLVGGSILLLEPGEAHRIVLSEPVALTVSWWDPEFMARTAAVLGVNGKVHFKVPELAPSSASDSFDELCAVLDRGEDAAAAEEHHARFLSELIRAVGEGAPARRPRGRYHPGVRRAVKYLATHLREPVSLNDLAATARMSKYHLVRVFREAEGFAPHQYLTLLRIREARRLVESGLSVVDAAGQAGFVDASHLSRTFRGWLGIAPGAWGRAFRASEPAYRRMPLTLPPPPEEELDLVSGGP